MSKKIKVIRRKWSMVMWTCCDEPYISVESDGHCYLNGATKNRIPGMKHGYQKRVRVTVEEI